MNETNAKSIAHSDSSLALQAIQNVPSPTEAEKVALRYILHRAAECGATKRHLRTLMQVTVPGPLSRRLANRIVKITTLLTKLRACPEDFRSWIIWSSGSQEDPGFLPIFLTVLPDNERDNVLKALHSRAGRSMRDSEAQDKKLFAMVSLDPHHQAVGRAMHSQARANFEVGDLENYRIQIGATRTFIRQRSQRHS